MWIQLVQVERVGKAFRGPSDGPIPVEEELGMRLVAEGKAKALDGPPADTMMRRARKKASAGSASGSSSRSDAGSALEPRAVDLWIVIPTKGRAEDLDRTLAAALFDPPEIGGVVVVNDGADEPTRRVVEGWRLRLGERLRYVETPTREGVAAARIRGNAEAPESAVVVEVDDHDTPEPRALNRVAEAFADPGVEAAYGDMYVVDEKGRLLRRVVRADYRPGLFREEGNQATGMRAYRKGVYTAVGGRRPEEKLASEYALFLRFEAHLDRTGRAGALRHIPWPLCRWPSVGDGISVRHAAEQEKAASRYAYDAMVGALFPSEEGAAPGAAAEAAELLLDGRAVGAFAFPDAPPDVSVVVPCYRSAGFVGALADSLRADGFAGSREVVWVLDGDGEQYPALPGKVVVRRERGGFAAACNTGAEHACGKHICLLNADTTVQPGWLEALLRAVGTRNVGAAGPTILKPDASVDSVGSRFDLDSGAFRHLCEAEADPRRDMMTGACLLVRRGLWDALGGLDEAYKLGYWEDTDLCMRIRRAGHDIVHAPDARVVHLGGHSGLGSAHPHYRDNEELFRRRWVDTGLVDQFARERGERVHDGRVCVCVIALNEAEYIGACLESVYRLADRIIVVEGGNEFSRAAGACTRQGRSVDGTEEAVRDFIAAQDARGIVEFHQPDRPWSDKAETRQFYLDRLEPGDWCFALDADEVFWDWGLWRLSALMHEADHVVVPLLTFWRDFRTVGRGKWDLFRIERRIFRVREGCRYADHVTPMDAEGRPVDRWQGARMACAERPLAAHYAWVKPPAKVRQKVEYYRRQCPDRFIPDDYVERIFLGWAKDPEAVNALGTHPMGGGTCEAWQGRHPGPIQRRLEAGLFGWARETE